MFASAAADTGRRGSKMQAMLAGMHTSHINAVGHMTWTPWRNRAPTPTPR